VALVQCLPFHLDGFPNVDKGGFNNCLISHVQIFQQEWQHDSEAETLDVCLVQNDCFVFESNGKVDVERLSGCIVGTGNNEHNISSCGTFSDAIDLSICLNECIGGGLFCTLDCLQNPGTLSPIVEHASACLTILADPVRIEHLILMRSCSSSLSENVHSTETLVKGCLQGLSKMTSCALEGPCKLSYLRFNGERSQLWTCTAGCIDDSRRDPLACLLDCYFE
jgi:hypothetical protein